MTQLAALSLDVCDGHRRTTVVCLVRKRSPALGWQVTSVSPCGVTGTVTGTGKSRLVGSLDYPRLAPHSALGMRSPADYRAVTSASGSTHVPICLANRRADQ